MSAGTTDDHKWYFAVSSFASHYVFLPILPDSGHLNVLIGRSFHNERLYEFICRLIRKES